MKNIIMIMLLAQLFNLNAAEGVLTEKKTSISEFSNDLKKTCNYLNKFIDNPIDLIYKAMELNTDFSKLCIKNLINPDSKTYNPKIAKKINEIFANTSRNSLLWKVTKFLINIGINPNFQDECGNTPLMFASILDKEDMISFLLKVGANPNIQNKDKITALEYAIHRDHENIVKLLLNSGKININFQGDLGSTLLLTACKSGYENIVELLLKAGADPNIKNKHGQYPLQFAMARNYAKNYENIVKLIKKYSSKT